MPHSTELLPGSIEASFNYMPRLKEGEKERLLYPKTMSYRRFPYEAHTQHVTDIRGHEDDFNVDTHGFQLCKAATIPEEVYSDEAKFKEVAYPETKDFLKKT